MYLIGGWDENSLLNCDSITTCGLIYQGILVFIGIEHVRNFKPFYF